MGETGAVVLFAGVVGIVVLFLALISIAVIILQIAGMWKMFEKAGEDGWKAIIPVYNYIILSKLVGVTPWWLLIVGICYLCCSIPFVNFVAWLPAVAAYYYYFIILGLGTARSYGKEDTWAVGLVLLPWLFYPLIGFKKEEKYLGVKEVKDPVWDWIIETFGNKSNKDNVQEAQVISEEPQAAKGNFCSSCGKKLRANAKKCPECGKEV